MVSWSRLEGFNTTSFRQHKIYLITKHYTSIMWGAQLVPIGIPTMSQIAFYSLQSKKEGKDQGSIQSSTTPDLGY